MPLDPNIILANADPARQYDPVAAMQKAQNLKAAMLQGQIQQQQLQDAQDFRQQYGVSPGMAKHVSEISTAKKNEEAARLAVQREYRLMDEHDQKQMEEMVTSIGTAARAVSEIPDPVAKWEKWQQALPTLAQQFAPTDADTPRMREIKTRRIAAMKDESDRLMAMKAPEDLDNILNEHWNDSKKKADWLVEAKRGDITGGIHADPNNLAFGVTKEGTAIPIMGPDGKQQRMRPPASAVTIGLGGPAGADSAKVYAERLVKGLEDWPSTVSIRTDPTIRQGLELARQIDPSFNASTHKQRQQVTKAFTTGKPAETTNALNTGMGHLGELSDLSEKLNNSSIKGYNTVANWIQKNTGDPTVTAFQTTKKAVADEVTRVWRGTGGSEKDVQEALSNLSEDLAPAQLRANIYQLTKLMASKQKALEDQYQKGMGRFGDLQVLNDEARAALGKIQERAGVKGTDTTGPSQSYKGKSLPTAVFNQLSEADKKKFTAGGGRID